MQTAAVRGIGSRRWTTVLVAVALIVPVLIMWTVTLRTLFAQEAPTAPTGRPLSTAWGDRVFSSSTELRRWLKARGVNYDTWAKHHAVAAAIVEHRPLPAVKHQAGAATSSAAVPVHTRRSPRKSADAARPRHSAARSAVNPESPVAAPRRKEQRQPIAGSPLVPFSLVVWALVLALTAVALAPPRWVARAGHPLGSFRLYAATAAVAIAVGTIAAQAIP